ncbi:hypothetical protein DAPK24_022180 [Pichia kluyveri]|uniref:SWIRM domain-containing protein n=1 Tax=Pichia kluyveri TaxID=36015 RepID=A0AAV5R443_PICKL|nr:hypothetical protein DAPK24_022180 [Pichia kluyveri]
MSLYIRDAMTPINDQNSNYSNIAGSSTLTTNDSENTILNNNDNNNSLSNDENDKQSNRTSNDLHNRNTPIIKSTSTLSLNMPSPPLSPYTRNDYNDNDNIPTLLFPRASKPLTSDLRYLENVSAYKYPSHAVTPKSYSSNISTSTSSNKDKNTNSKPLQSPSDIKVAFNDEKTDTIKETKTENNVSDDNYILSEDSILHINPYKQMNKHGFKKLQINFLSEYQFKSFNTSYSYYNNNSNNTSSTSSKSNKSYDTTKSNTNSNYNSDSELEKRRTRRLVRQNKFELETIDSNESIISRPSTPTIKKRPTSNLSSPSTPKRQRTATPIIYNYDYKKIEDFCPELSTLPNNNKCLKTDWKGQSMDLSTDSLINELHPAEVMLASILRLPCAVYLDSKRRIFQEKVKRMRAHLPFRRTDAQKSCKIDVNKASRLFASFEKVGWFDEKHFQKYMK